MFVFVADTNDFDMRITDIVVLFIIPLLLMGFMYGRIATRLWGKNTAVSESLRRKRKVRLVGWLIG
jgi:hypothetical protein